MKPKATAVIAEPVTVARFEPNRDAITPAASTPSVCAEPQPHTVVSLIATSASEMPVLIRTAAGQLTRPATRTGDSGTNRHVQNAAATISGSGIQKSQCQLRCSTTSPPV